MVIVYSIHTIIIVRRVRSEELMEDGSDGDLSLLILLMNLILGSALVSTAAGARPLAPWKVKDLPDDTWIVDVRTPPEYSWNRLRAAENYPFGVGAAHAAEKKSKDTEVLVICFSGHRSAPVAVALRKLGFKNVYNLNWGLFYYMLLKRGRRTKEPFELTRPFLDAEPLKGDLKWYTYGYSVLGSATAIGAPLEWYIQNKQLPILQSVFGGFIGITGLILVLLSAIRLGKNFRPFLAPKANGNLVTTGIYSYIRHPMYIGTILSLLGLVVTFCSIFTIPAWLGVTILYLIKIEKEEPLLIEKYPDYEGYRRRTCRLIPYVCRQSIWDKSA